MHRDKVKLPDGRSIPVIGQGTWNIGDRADKRQEEIRALRKGVELGLNLIDTAEMYGDGRSEMLVGEAIAGVRDDVFLVSKVYPHHAGRKELVRSCEQSLRRLRTDRLDLYLLHWRGGVPLEETAEGMERLVEAGKIRGWGVSNFDTSDMQELLAVPGGERCLANQVLYHLGSRGIEYDLLPWQQERGIPTMAYCPLAQAGSLRTGLLQHPAVVSTAARHGVKPIQIVLAWAIRHDGVTAIPKASSEQHVIENAAAAQINLDETDIRVLNAAFPAPTKKAPLDIV